MRFVILPLVLVLVQLLTYGFGLLLHWLLRPMLPVSLMAVMVGVFVLSNALVASAFLGHFRLTTAWLALLWLGFLGAGSALLLLLLLKKLGLPAFGLLLPRAFVLSSIVGVVGLALYNAYTPVVRHLTITLDKPMPTPVVMAVASDLHLGALVGVRELELLEKLVKENEVDILLLPGDIMDDNTDAFEARHMAQALKRALAAPKVASVASLGNHDLYQAHAYDAITRTVQQAGVVLLNDQSTQIAVNKEGKTTFLEFVGRFDDHKTDRLPTQALLASVDTTRPVILLDHRPSQIDQNSTLPIDLQVSGHTHNGQIFPANFIVAALNRVGYGYEQVGEMHTVVSSGFGFWGIPFRLGSQAELWVITMKAKEV